MCVDGFEKEAQGRPKESSEVGAMAADGRQDSGSTGNTTGEEGRPLSRREGLERYFGGHLYLPAEIQIGPAPVPDDDGQEHVLVHFVGINGQWLWSSIEPEYIAMPDLQARWGHEAGVANEHGTDCVLVWDPQEIGPYPPGETAGDGRRPSLPDFKFDDSLRYVTGVRRSEDTKEVFVTAYKVTVASFLG